MDSGDLIQHGGTCFCVFYLLVFIRGKYKEWIDMKKKKQKYQNVIQNRMLRRDIFFVHISNCNYYFNHAGDQTERDLWNQADQKRTRKRT
jgi:hypothetical protein